MLLAAAAALVMMAVPSDAFAINSHITSRFALPAHTISARTNRPAVRSSTQILMSSWDGFAFDDDDELLDSGVDADFVAADENDDAAVKAAAGASLEAPEVDYDGPVIDVPQGV